MRLEIINDNPDRVPACKSWSAEPADECEPADEHVRLDIRFWLGARRTARELAKILASPRCRAEMRENIVCYTEEVRKLVQRARNGRIRHISTILSMPKLLEID